MLPQNIGDNQASISSSRSRKSQRSNSPPGNQGLLRPPSGGVRRKNSPPSGQILSRASSGVVSVSPVEVNGREPIQVRSGSSGMFPELNQPQSGRRKSGNSQRGLPELVRNAAKDGVHLTGEEYQQLLKELENVDLTQEERMYLASQSGPQGEQLAGGKARRMSKQSSSNRSDTLSRNHPFFKLLLNRKNSSRPLNTEELALAAGGGGGGAEGGAPRALGPVSPVQTGSARGGGGGGGGLMAGGGARPAAAGAPGGAGGSNGGGAGLMETGAGGGGGGGRAPGAPAAEGFPPGGGGSGGGARGGRGAGLGALRKGSAKPGSLLEGMLGSELFGMQRIVLKFTTVSEGSEPSAFTVDTQGVRIGRGPENKVSIPSDTTMRAREHARIDHDPREGAFRLVDLGNRHGAAVRIPVGPGLREWPLREDAAFSAGNSVFVVVSVDGPGGAPSPSPPADGGGGGGGGGADGAAAAAAAGGGGGGGGAGAAGGGGGAGDDAEPALFLEVTSGPLRGERRRVGREGAALGRATDNAISVADKELSRRHSLVEYDRGRGAYFLCDVGSTNGTYMQLVGPYANSYKLTFSDHILVGRTGFSINRFDYGVSEEIGRRPNMEDKSIIIQDLGIEHLYQLGMGPQSFVAVYDGHGGAHASNYLWRHLHLNVSEALEKVGQEIQAAHPGAGPGAVPARLLDELVAAGVARCFRRTDEHYLNTSDNPQCGSTATTVLIIGNRFYNFNVGDSRTLLCRNGKVRLVSQDHKPSREDETERIKKAGGFVIHKRVMGELAVSRAFGDKEFKMGLQAILNEEGRPGPDGGGAGAGGGGGGGAGGGGGGDREEGAPPLPEKPLITAEPEILTAILDPEDDFIVLACDGVFDVMSNEEVAELIDQEMMQHGDTQRAVEMLSHTAIHKRRTRDNVTIVLVCLRKWWQAGQEEG